MYSVDMQLTTVGRYMYYVGLCMDQESSKFGLHLIG